MIEGVRETTLVLLNARAADATICPSEVARLMIVQGKPEYGAQDWRGVMPLVHKAVDELVAEGRVRLSWKGKTLSTRSGPYRIGRST